MDIRKVKKLIELLEESGISELEISEGEETGRISRHARGGTQPVIQYQPTPAAAAATAAVAPAAPGAPARPVSDEHTIVSPMVGTYYSSPSPGAKVFVEIGSEIQIGRAAC